MAEQRKDEYGQNPGRDQHGQGPGRDDVRPCRHKPEDERYMRDVACKEQRMLKSRREGHKDVWFGLGMFGIVGWSVAIPTLAGIALGIWIDSRTQSGYSWTLMLLGLGVIVGCLNAWYWIKREGRHD